MDGDRLTLIGSGTSVTNVRGVWCPSILHKQGNHLRPGRDRELDGETWDQLPGIDHPAVHAARKTIRGHKDNRPSDADMSQQSGPLLGSGSCSICGQRMWLVCDQMHCYPCCAKRKSYGLRPLRECDPGSGVRERGMALRRL